MTIPTAIRQKDNTQTAAGHTSSVSGGRGIPGLDNPISVMTHGGPVHTRDTPGSILGSGNNEPEFFGSTSVIYVFLPKSKLPPLFPSSIEFFLGVTFSDMKQDNYTNIWTSDTSLC